MSDTNGVGTFWAPFFQDLSDAGAGSLLLLKRGVQLRLSDVGRLQKELTQAIHHGVQPLTRAEWRTLFESEGFTMQSDATSPMHLLEPRRLIQDEGIRGSLRFARNMLADAEARRRVLAMRSVFRRHQSHLAAIMLIGAKPDHVSR